MASATRAGPYARRRYYRYLAGWTALVVTAALFVAAVTPDRWPFAFLVLAVFPIGFAPRIVEEGVALFDGARGEVLVDRLLAELGPNFRILHDVDAGAERGTIEHVVVGPTGVYSLRTKRGRGLVYPGRNGRLMCDKRNEHDIVRRAMSEAVELRARMERHDLDVFAHPLVVYTRAHLEQPVMGFGSTAVLDVDALLPYLRTFRGRALTPDDVARGAAAVLGAQPLRARVAG